MPDEWLRGLVVFHGAASQAEARIYARLPREGLPPDVRLEGRIVGPQCELAQTLPATIRLTDRGPGSSLLAEAIVPDPCFWTPELPFLYRVEVALKQGSASVAQIERCFGIRRLGVRDGNLLWEGKRWVLRGVEIDEKSLAQREFSFCRPSGTTLLVRGPTDQLCQVASQQGTLLVADISRTSHEPNAATETLLGDLQRLACWPAVGLAVLPIGHRLSAAMLSAIAPNLLFAERVDCRQAVQLSPATKVLLCEMFVAVERLPSECSKLPVIACRSLTATEVADDEALEALRRRCDQLQASLTELGDFAGYIVSAQ